jgi:hypothetical protein
MELSTSSIGDATRITVDESSMSRRKCGGTICSSLAIARSAASPTLCVDARTKTARANASSVSSISGGTALPPDPSR